MSDVQRIQLGHFAPGGFNPIPSKQKIESYWEK